MKKVISIICVIIVMIAVVVGTLLGFLTMDEYKPKDIESLEIIGNSVDRVKKQETTRLLSWNLGYGALGDNADFFMDGGKMVYTADEDRVVYNLEGFISEFEKISPDIICTQETDRNSDRSHFIDEVDYFFSNSGLRVLHGNSVFAPNLKVSFIPLPVPPIGKVYSGLMTFSKYNISSAQRLQLPCPFKWPLRTFNLKRCLEVVRFNVVDTDKELVVINLHLEAYDSGEGKIAQANMLKEVLDAEVEKGNYVIACGDFNQVFSNIDVSAYPVLEGKWEAGRIDVSDFSSDLTFSADNSVPSCRSLDQPLDKASEKDPEHFQYYVIDGFITSSNVEVESVYTDDLSFVHSDHNPVILEFKLK
ncbi:endonuclease [Butyrivibrio sp. CB08]|uniref:endonuclease/exonuclease/phosphatase family protein n=1 Tax=Butyrivibrio sp. CB08 TaxID=2364879 RepID=UPI000EA97DC3|nr:endonuclease/exonuclease/phosphatase family protein [Butyrivibrio sp. CB08]RKM62277.1 endonuclease [Butyrivibrio sp. CB08]